MLRIGVLLAIVCVLFLVAQRAFIAASRLRIPAGTAAGILIAMLVYLSALIPGSLGLLYPWTLYGVFLLLSMLVLRLLSRLTGLRSAGGTEAVDSRGYSAAEAGMLGLGLVAALPLITYLRWGLPSSLLKPDKTLGWDAATYHLPGFIEFHQNHTLWSMQGPYQSYCYGFELIGNFLSYPFFTHWGLILANLFAIGLLVAGIAELSCRLAHELPGVRTPKWAAIAALAVGIWCLFDPDSIGYVGKNDVFMTAALVAALGFLLRIAETTPDDDPVRLWSLVVLAGVGLGLAVATKPSALAFAPYFALAAWFTLRSAPRAAGLAAVLVLAITAVLGGFWFVRNLLVAGALAPVAGEAVGLSLIANPGDLIAFGMTPDRLFAAAAVLALLPGGFLLWRCRRQGRPGLPLGLLLGFHAVGVAAFLVTPYVILPTGPAETLWQLRLGMPMCVSAALIYSLTAGWLAALIAGWPARSRSGAALALILLSTLALTIHWRGHPVGLSGHDEVRGLPRTGVYVWVQGLPAPRRIYAAGLLPYGLYGPHWAHRLFYDLKSTDLSPFEAGKGRIAAVVFGFSPDLILVSVDPRDWSGAREKPEVVAWMRAHPDCFEEVYNDETASGFAVRAVGCEWLRAEIPAGYRLRMGG